MAFQQPVPRALLDARSRFHQAAYQPATRAAVIDDLKGDAALQKHARDELARMEEVIAARGAMADHISVTTAAFLRSALAQVDAAPTGTVTIEQAL